MPKPMTMSEGSRTLVRRLVGISKLHRLHRLHILTHVLTLTYLGEEARRDLDAIKAQEEQWETEDEEERARKKAEDDERDRREKERLEREAKEAADEEKRQKVQLEARRRAALRRLTICPAGFSWYKCPGGYRCGGGTHFVTDATVDAHL